MKYRLASILLVTAVTSGGVASAQPSETDRSLAQSLFEQGKQLMDSGNFEQACPKLEESQRLDPGGGTLLNLALCHEKQGKIATAWSDFKAALSDAKRDARQDRIDAASEHIAALEPKLPWLTLAVTGPVDGEEIKLDGAAIGKAVWGTPVAIDPGPHGLSVAAPGKKTWVQTLTMAAAEKKTVTVPALETAPTQARVPAAVPGPAPSPPAPVTPGDQRNGGGSRTVGWIVGGAGVAALGVGVFAGIEAISKRHKSDGECPTDTTCTPQGKAWNDQAKTFAWVSNFSVGLGLVGIGVGTYLVLSGHGGAEEPTRAQRPPALVFDAAALPGGGWADISGAW